MAKGSYKTMQMLAICQTAKVPSSPPCGSKNAQALKGLTLDAAYRNSFFKSPCQKT